jgi:hypothetical protein
MGVTIDIIECWLQECWEVMLPINLTMPRHTTIDTAPMLAMIAHKLSDMHHTQPISSNQHEEDLRSEFMLDLQPILLKCNQMLKPGEQE